MVIDKRWTLFLDRDGVINKRVPGGYVTKPEDFVFLPGVKKALAEFSRVFGKIILVTNQQGIGKKIMTEQQLDAVHAFMLKEIMDAGGRIDRIYHSPFLESENNPYRKPGTGMALQALKDFPQIRFDKSVMAGDSATDIDFGRNSGMVTVLINPADTGSEIHADYTFEGLPPFARFFLDHYVTQ
ncbi:MAG: HAD family hydrolase [Bacteroidales bacterium]|nr:HAD family hydrolase [Bacteroidales bacterium]